MKALLKLPETWHVVVNDENRTLLEDWRFEGKKQGLQNGNIVGIYGRTDYKCWDFFPNKSSGQEITTADFKRLVLGEKNFEDYCVQGSQELVSWFEINQPNMDGKNHNRVFYFNGNDWRSEFYCRSKKIELPLSEYLKLLPQAKEKETIEPVITTVKTWETIYFKTENVSIELTLNHDKQTFDLSTNHEESVSFKSDTIEEAKEKLKCIEVALNYVQKHLNQNK